MSFLRRQESIGNRCETHSVSESVNTTHFEGIFKERSPRKRSVRVKKRNMTIATGTLDLTNFRSRFPILTNKAYLNSCSQGALSNDVEAAYAQYIADWHGYGSPWDLWVGKLEETRAAFAALVNAQVDEVAVTTSVSAAVSTVASALDFSGPRNKVWSATSSSPPSARSGTHRNAAVQPSSTYTPMAITLTLDRFAEAIDERTLLVSITHVCYRNGAMLDVPAIVDLAHGAGPWSSSTASRRWAPCPSTS